MREIVWLERKHDNLPSKTFPRGNICNCIWLEGKVLVIQPCVLTGDSHGDNIPRLQIFYILNETWSFVGFVLHSLLLSGDFLLKQEKGLKGLFTVCEPNNPDAMTWTVVPLTSVKFHQTDQIPAGAWGKKSIIKDRWSFQKECQHRHPLCQTFLLLTRCLPFLSVTQPIAKLLLVKAQTDSTKMSLHIWESSLLLPCTLGRGDSPKVSMKGWVRRMSGFV